jgi:hypothetical protein
MGPPPATAASVLNRSTGQCRTYLYLFCITILGSNIFIYIFDVVQTFIGYVELTNSIAERRRAGSESSSIGQKVRILTIAILVVSRCQRSLLPEAQVD